MTVYLYVLSIVLLVVTLLFGSGAGTAASVKGWLTIGGVRIGQPAELAKLTVVLMLARVLAARKEAPKSLLDLWKPALVVGGPWLLIMAQPDLGTGVVFIGIFFALLYWSGVSWQLLALIASPAVSLILAFNTGLWGAWFLILIALVLYYRPYIVEGVVLVLANVAMGVIAPLLWERLALPAASPPLPRPFRRPESFRLPRATVAGGHRIGRLVREGIHTRYPEAAGVPASPAYGLHLLGGG
jgi:rod shape determining protein RodA